MDTKKTGSPKALRGMQISLLECEEGLKIPLTQGKFALIDSRDLPLIQNRLWYAWSANRRTFYAVTSTYEPGLPRKFIRMHHVIGRILKGKEIDHGNGNGLDNRRYNLRHATHSQNQQNSVSKGNITGFKGVFLAKSRRYCPQIRVKGKLIHLGTFKSAETAARIYDAMAVKYFGEFARTNFPQ